MMKKRMNSIKRPMRAPARPHRPVRFQVDRLRLERKRRLVRAAEVGRVGIAAVGKGEWRSAVLKMTVLERETCRYRRIPYRIC